MKLTFKHFSGIAPLLFILVLLGLVLFFKFSKDSESITDLESSDSSQRSAGAASSTERNSSRTPRKTYQELVGMKIESAQSSNSEKWCSALSRNPHEYKMREYGLKHLRRGEVISFKIPDEDLAKLTGDNLPVTLTLPFFNGETANVSINHMNVSGENAGTLAGHFADRPEVSVVLGMHGGETSGIVEGPDMLYFLDAFSSNVVILRELDSASHNADFECDCQLHQARKSQ